MNSDPVIQDLENQPWYQSTQGPKISTTVQAIAALVLPVIQTMFPGKITTGIPTVDRAINVILIIGFGLYALYGYIRAKKTFATQLSGLRNQIKAVSGKIPPYDPNSNQTAAPAN